MKDIIGRLFREFALTLSVTILISAFVSLTLTPMLCARILHQRQLSEAGWFKRRSEALLAEVIRRYSLSLRWVLDRQTLTIVVAALTLALTTILLYFIPKGFFPIQDTGLIQGISEMSQDISFEAMRERQQALARVVLQDPAVESLSSFIGIDGTNITLNSGRMLIALKPLSQRHVSASEVLRRLQPQLAHVYGATLYMQPVQDLTIDDRVSRTQYQYSLNGPDKAEVSQGASLMMDKLRHSPILRDVASDEQNKGLQTYISFDRDTAYRLGVTPQMIDDTLYDAFGQRQVSIMFTQRNQYRVVLEVLPKLQRWPQGIENIYVNSSIINFPKSKGAVAAATTPTVITGKSVPLSAFTTVSQQLGPLVINRQDQFPVATLSFNLAPGYALGDALEVVQAAKKELRLPDSLATSFEGAAKIFQNSLSNEGWLVVAAIVTVYIILGVLYESYIHPLTILSTLPSACVGALLALILTRNALSVIALIGIILLIGIVMKNAILMIDFALEQERQYQKPPLEAIYQACLLRFRPILMTTLASMLGAVPLALGSGMGSELRQPLGIAIIGGLVMSQVMTLYTTPVIYLAFDRLAREFLAWRARWFAVSSP